MKFTWKQSAAAQFDLIYAEGRNGKGLGRDVLHAGGSGGYMAVNLAYHLGARWIGLLGFDMQFTDGKSHWHGDHRGTGNPNPADMAIWAQRFIPLYEDLKREGVELVNCTRDTALTIPRADLDDVLNG